MLPSPMKNKFIDISLSFSKYYVLINPPGRLGITGIEFDLQVPYNNFGQDVGYWCVRSWRVEDLGLGVWRVGEGKLVMGVKSEAKRS